MQLNSGVYKITNVLTLDFYIGSSINIKIRKSAHFGTLKRQVHKNIHLQRAYNREGVENFIFEILATCPKEYCIKLEQWFIDNLKPTYNFLQIAGNSLGYVHTQETKDKLSLIKKESGMSKEHELNFRHGFIKWINQRDSKYKKVANLIKKHISKDKICKELNLSDSQYRLLKNQAINKGFLEKQESKKKLFIKMFNEGKSKEEIIKELSLKNQTYKTYKSNYLKNKKK